MRCQLFTSIGLLLLLVGCGGGKQSTEQISTKRSPAATEEIREKEPPPDPPDRLLSANEKNPAALKLEAFLKWYMANQIYVDATRWSAINTFDYSGQAYDFDQKMADRYIAILDSTGFFTPAFVSEQKRKFLAVKKSLIDEPIHRGVPNGMDYNWLLGVHEIPIFWKRNELPKAYFIGRESDSNIAFIIPRGSRHMCFRLVRVNGNWLLDESLGNTVD